MIMIHSIMATIFLLYPIAVISAKIKGEGRHSQLGGTRSKLTKLYKARLTSLK